MSLRDQLQTALKEAMKAKQADRLSTLRLINAAIKDRDIANRGEGGAAQQLGQRHWATLRRGDGGGKPAAQRCGSFCMWMIWGRPACLRWSTGTQDRRSSNF